MREGTVNTIRKRGATLRSRVRSKERPTACSGASLSTVSTKHALPSSKG